MRWNGKNFRPAGLGRKPQVNPQPRSISKPFNYKDLKLVGQFFGGLGQEEGPAPTPSVTPSITPTPSMTPTPSPTISPTPTPTPSSTPPLLCDFDYEYVAEVSISPTGASQNQNVILSGSTDLDSPTFTWSLTSFNDASGSTVSSYTGNPLTEGYFTTTGSSNVTLTAVGEDPFGNTITATTSTFEVLPSTVLILASSNNGTSTQRSYDSVNWTGGTLPGNTNNEWASMATNGEGLVVAANREPNDTEQFAYTYDGVNWTGDTYSGSTNFRMSNIVWSEYLRKFVTSATDNAIGSFILQSSTGFNWGTFTTPSNDVCTIISDEKNDLLIIQDEVSRGVYSSPDGVTWTLRFTAGNRIFASIHNKTLGLDIMVEESTHQVRISSDGINYTNPAQLVNIGASQTTSIAYRRSDGRTIVCSYTTNAGYYTDDGSTWTQFTMPAANVIALTYAERTGEWVAIDRDGDVFTSTTGISGWTSQTKANTADYRFVGEFIFRD